MRWLFAIALLLACQAHAVDIFYAVHNAPQGAGDGSSPTDGTTIQDALDRVAAAGDEVRICNTGTYTLAGQIDVDGVTGTAASFVLVTGAASDGTVDGTKADIVAASNNDLFVNVNTTDYYIFQHLDISGTATSSKFSFSGPYNFCILRDITHTATGGSTFGFGATFDDTTLERLFVDLTLQSAGAAIYTAYAGRMYAIDCTVLGGDFGFGTQGPDSNSTFVGCKVRGTTTGFSLAHISDYGAQLINCEITECTDGIKIGSTAMSVDVVGCTIADNTDNGIELAGGTLITVTGSIITHNGGYGIDRGAGTAPKLFESRNNFGASTWANTLGDVSGTWTLHDSDVTTDPGFQSRAGDDYTLDSGSAAIQSPYTNQDGDIEYRDFGAYQAEVTGGGGGNPQLVNGGLVK